MNVTFRANPAHNLTPPRREGIVYAHRAPRFRAPRFGTGDVVKMVVDFEKSTITFLLNDVLVKCVSHIDKLPASLRVVVAFANEQQRIRISRVGDNTESLAALCGDSSEENDVMSLFFAPSALSAAPADAETVAAAAAVNGGAALAVTRRLAVWSRWTDVVDAPVVSPFVETGMDGSRGSPNRMPTRTPSGVVSSPREPSGDDLEAEATARSSSGATRAGASMRADADDLGWESAAEVRAMCELVSALRCRGGGTWVAPTTKTIDALYMASVDKVWDWGRGAPTFDVMRVSPAIEVGPFAPGDELRPLIAPIVRLLAGRVAMPVEDWVDHSCLVNVAVPELGTSVTVRIAAAHLLPVESQPYVFERGRAEPGALGAHDSVARAALRLDHTARGAAASMALGALAAMLRPPHEGGALRRSAPRGDGAAHAFSVAQIGGAAAVHCVVRQLLLGAGHVTTACAIVDRVLAVDARAIAAERGAVGGDADAGSAVDADSAQALLRRALWSGALYGDAAIAVPNPVGFAMVALLQKGEAPDSHELRRGFAALCAALAQAPRRGRPAAIRAMSSLLRNALSANALSMGAEAPTTPTTPTKSLGLAVSAKRLYEVRSKVLECAHVGTLESTYQRPDLQNCIELVALLGRAHAVQQRFELSEGGDALALSTDERKQLRIEALTNGAHPSQVIPLTFLMRILLTT